MKATEPFFKKKQQQKIEDIIANANAHNFPATQLYSYENRYKIKKIKKSYAQPRHSLIIYHINKIQITNPA